MAFEPTFPLEIVDGFFHIREAPAKASREMFDARPKAGVAQAEAEDVHVDRASQQQGKKGFGCGRHVRIFP